MTKYSIGFKLLLPRWKIFRLDVLPFIIIYGLLGYYLYELYDHPILNLYLRLAIIGACFLQSRNFYIKA